MSPSTSSGSPASDELVTIAMIGGTDAETRTIVEEVLAGLGVRAVIEGSAVYGVQVPHADQTRAQTALRAEPRLSGRWIEYVEPPGS